MKRLWAAAGILALLAALAGWHTVYLSRLTEELDALLTQAEAQVEQENWSRGEALTRQALDLWKENERYLHIALRHQDVDGVFTGFHEVIAYLEGGERQPAEYAAANARLRVQLSLLREEEMPSLQNIL